MPDPDTFRSLVYASPFYYRIYRKSRDEIWTQTALRYLAMKEICILDGLHLAYRSNYKAALCRISIYIGPDTRWLG